MSHRDDSQKRYGWKNSQNSQNSDNRDACDARDARDACDDRYARDKCYIVSARRETARGLRGAKSWVPLCRFAPSRPHVSMRPVRTLRDFACEVTGSHKCDGSQNSQNSQKCDAC